MPRDGLYIGLMSGTSMDGIDAALVELEAGRVTLRHARLHPWPEPLRRRLRAAAAGEPLTAEALGELDHLAGAELAAAALALLEEAGVPPAAVTAVGSHGQTLWHRPGGAAPFSLQIGDASLIAQRTGITTVADFRRRDMAAGGEGAPLVPRFHEAALGHPRRHRTVLNLGGIANLTVLPAGGGVSAAFDCGPGNCLMDGWVRRHLDRPFDEEGAWAAGGRCLPELLEALLADPYFDRPPPKSTGPEHFSGAWLEARLASRPEAAPQDVQATLAELTAQAAARAVRRWAPETEELLVCGGGRRNRHLLARLAACLPGIPVRGTESAGVDPDWLEAMAFAWLAAATLAGEPGNLPAATGAREAVVLGTIHPA